MHPTIADYLNYPKNIDFISFYAASKLVLIDQPSSLYDYKKLYAVEKELAYVGSDKIWAWHYPPIFILMILPLAYMSYYFSLFLWLTTTFLGFLITAYYVIPNMSILWIVLAFPGTIINFTHGQNGFLTAALLAGGLLLLEKRPILAGILLGLLSYKPQFGILVPFALIAGKYWKTIFSTLITTMSLIVLSLLFFGSETWLVFFSNTKWALSLIEQGMFKLWRMPTIFAGTVLLINNVYIARIFQSIMFAGAVIIIFFTWYNRKIPLSLRAALLVILTLLSAPYLYDYDLTVLLFPIVWLWYSPYYERNLISNKIIFMLGYAMPLLASVVASEIRIQIGPFILLGLLWITFKQIQKYKTTEAAVIA